MEPLGETRSKVGNQNNTQVITQVIVNEVDQT